MCEFEMSKVFYKNLRNFQINQRNVLGKTTTFLSVKSQKCARKISEMLKLMSEMFLNKTRKYLTLKS